MPIIRSIRCWVAAYGFLHRVCGWVVVLRAAAWVMCMVRMVQCDWFCQVHWREVAVPILWPVPEAVVTVFSTPDDGCGGYPKHVEWFCSKINHTAYCCNLLAFHIISWGRCALKQPSNIFLISRVSRWCLRNTHAIPGEFFIRVKATGVWSWPLSFIWSGSYECFQLYFPPPLSLSL